MTVMSCRKIKKNYGDLAVLDNIELDIEEDGRIGLVGRNGAGKSTLAEILFGRLQPDEGVLTYTRREFRIGYLMQSTAYTLNLFSDMPGIGGEPDAMASFLEMTGYLGLKKVQQWDMERFGHLSGGERTKMVLAKIWSTKPDFLILDEPTNHLDFHGVEWLVRELERFEGAALIISHDRYFLDRTVKRILELEDGGVREYAGNYTFYREEKKRRYQSQLHQYRNEQKYKAKIEAEISRLERWSSKAHREAGKVGKMADMRMGVKEFYRTKAKKMDRQIKSRLNRLKRIEFESVEKPKEEPAVAFGFDHPAKRGRRIFEAKQAGKSFGSRLLFRDSSFTILRGEKIGLVGPNGCGKTTFLRMLLGDEPADRGELWFSPSARAGVLTQDVGDLDKEEPAIDLFQAPDMGAARSLLANMGFDAAMLQKPVRQLSLGERTRLKIAALILREPDLLILDEPTNHLDLHSREQLEHTLSDYKGTILLVSHDRYLIERICDHMLLFTGETIIKRQGVLFAELKDDGAPSTGSGVSGQNGSGRDEGSGHADAEAKLIVEHRISVLLGELSKFKPADSEYGQLDKELNDLMRRKNSL